MFYICCINPRTTKNVSAHEGSFSSLLNLRWDIAHKYLTGLISWNILRSGNSSPEDEFFTQRPDHNTLNYIPYSLRSVSGFFNAPQSNYEQGL